jgi:hypothetical protein
MMLGVVASNGAKMKPVWFPKGYRLTGPDYLDILKKKVLPWAKRMSMGTPFVFQQDGAPAHTSKVVQKKLDGQMTFKPQDFWPPQSPDRDPGQPLTCEQVPHLAERLMGFPWTFS